MEFFLHIWTNLEYFKLLNDWNLLSKGKSDRDLATFFMQNFPGELAWKISAQYEINFMAIREIKKRFGQEVFSKIDWIYYWSDNCEYLIPYRREIEEAMNQFREFNKIYPPHKTRTFTLVTPYLGNKMLNKLEESLDYLNSLNIKNPIEIVINDLWVLRLVTNKYTNLKPIFGRLIHKILKTPLIDTYGYWVHPAWELIKNKQSQEIEILKDEIIKWQLKFYSSSEMNLPEYKSFLDRYKINRVALDFMEKRDDLYENKNDLWIDLYYPWALVFTWRLCDTSSIENPDRWNYAIDDICPRTCNRYDIFYDLKTIWYNLIQRGNSAYRSELNLDYLPENFTKNESNRFVFAPFITV